jgi:MOSC domain-containing protein YiiM
MKSVHSVQAESGKGLVARSYRGTKHRHVRVQSCDDLTEGAAMFEAPTDHDLTRRTIAVTGLKIPTSVGERIRIDGVHLEIVQISATCTLLDDDHVVPL